MVSRADADTLDRLTTAVADAAREIVGGPADVHSSWIDEYPNEPEILFEIVLPPDAPSQDKATQIRTTVRERTAELLPGVVATTRLVMPGADDD